MNSGPEGPPYTHSPVGRVFRPGALRQDLSDEPLSFQSRKLLTAD